MQTQRILLIGGPSTGKTTIISSLKKNGYTCFEEISREIIIDAQKDGIEQLFLDQPLLFSEKLLEGRIQQFKKANHCNQQFVFYDRGIPDTVAYLDYIKSSYSEKFINACKAYKYDRIFLLKIWKDIYQQDNERYETIEEAQLIEKHLIKTYEKYGYNIDIVPFGSIKERVKYILNHL